MTTRTPYTQLFTDDRLDADAASDAPGPRNRARHLRRLDTPERRARASSEGMTLTNIMGGRPSDNVHRAVHALLGMIAAGREDDELYGERFSREARDRDRIAREADPYCRRLDAAMRSL